MEYGQGRILLQWVSWYAHFGHISSSRWVLILVIFDLTEAYAKCQLNPAASAAFQVTSILCMLPVVDMMFRIESGDLLWCKIITETTICCNKWFTQYFKFSAQGSVVFSANFFLPEWHVLNKKWIKISPLSCCVCIDGLRHCSDGEHNEIQVWMRCKTMIMIWRTYSHWESQIWSHKFHLPFLSCEVLQFAQS